MITDSLLGKHTTYPKTYDPTLLMAIPRQGQRQLLPQWDSLNITGVDIWNCYEFSYLTMKGKPVVALLELHIEANSDNIIESKSLKLYLNSFYQMQFTSRSEVEALLYQDLSKILAAPMNIIWHDMEQNIIITPPPQARLIDNIDIACHEYQVNTELLRLEEGNIIVAESLYSNLLKSNCLITNQPDWATIIIEYLGPKIAEASLLQYIISYREHSEFHEHCIERIFCDIMAKCHPQELTIYGRYTRRGGIDINPYRTNKQHNQPHNFRLLRQ